MDEMQSKTDENKYEIRLSARALVEFIFRSGDIDNRRRSVSEKAMLEGSRLHRKIQKSMGDGYRAEVPLRYVFTSENYVLKLDGRADGVIDPVFVSGQTAEERESVGRRGDETSDGTREDASTYGMDDGELSALLGAGINGTGSPEDLRNALGECGPLYAGAITEAEDGQRTIESILGEEEFPLVTIDEIKCVYAKVERMTEPIFVHLAQAKVYAFIYCQQNNLPMIRVRMTYCNIKTESMKYFFEDYSRKQITDWFLELMEAYRRWADFQFIWYAKRKDSAKLLQFPFAYRSGQRELAVNVYKTIKAGKKLFLEAPTGVGKTLTTLFPAVKAIGEGLLEKIFYLTARTITRTVADDTLELMRGQGLCLKSVIITAKEKICPLEKAECNPETCPRAGGHYDRVNDAIYEAITKYDRLDREAIERIAEKHNVCPFELSLDISSFADAIICDYNYVFDPHVRLKRYFSDGEGGQYAFLVDEAHNLVDRGRDMFSAELVKEDFLALKRKIGAAVEKLSDAGRGRRSVKGKPLLFKLAKGLEHCNSEMLELKRGCEKFQVLESVDPLVGQLESLYTAMVQYLEEEENTGVRDDVLEFWFVLGHFLMIFEYLDENYRIYSEKLEDGRFRCKLLCVNPRKNLADAMAKGRSSILFSATLLPVQYYKNLLGGEKEDYEVYAQSSFSRDRLGVFVDRGVTSRYSRRSDEMYYRIATQIRRITSVHPGNYMVFFPSFAFLNMVYDSYLQFCHVPEEEECLRQEARMSEEEREAFLARFSRTALVESGVIAGSRDTLLGFCVLGGIFSEGIDLREDALIGSLIVGTGLPLLCDERELIKDFFGEKGYDYAYRYPGMNKVLQAAGRVIRTEKDKGIVALLDDRFLESSYQRLFPREWSGFLAPRPQEMEEAVWDFWECGEEE